MGIQLVPPTFAGWGPGKKGGGGVDVNRDTKDKIMTYLPLMYQFVCARRFAPDVTTSSGQRVMPTGAE